MYTKEITALDGEKINVIMQESEFDPFDCKPITLDYDPGLQEAINMSCKKNTAISFQCGIPPDEIRELLNGKGPIDWKGCGVYASDMEAFGNGFITIQSVKSFEEIMS